MKKYSFGWTFALIAFPFIVFGCFKLGFIEDPYYILPNGHFYIVSTVAFLAMVIAMAIGIAGNRIRNIKVSFLSLSFFSLAQMFLVHGLSTPHFLLQHETHLPGVAAQLSIILATCWLCLSSLSSDNKIIEWLARRQRKLLPIWVNSLSVLSIICLAFPSLVDILPVDVKPLNWLLTLIVVALNIVIIFRYSQSYQYSRFPLQLAIVYSSGWFIVSQLIMVLGEMWRLSWWIYHFVLLASMVVIVIGLIKQYAVKKTIGGAIQALFTSDPFERVTGSMSPSVKALVVATEQKDTYTAGHTFRVTMYALKLGEELHLKPEELRAIAQGTLVHDVGKIKVPDSVLNKPGRLTPEERELIEKHPLSGYEMCKDLGFMGEELSIIRSHHEKWDGSGYPDKLQKEEIPYLARIVAVADVYDALTSTRSYRKAWEHLDAMNLLVENKGSHFDPVCVEAWVHICEKNPSVYQKPASEINDGTSVTTAISTL